MSETAITSILCTIYIYWSPKRHVSDFYLFIFFADHLRKDKSLGIMSQKFLMLFLVSKVSH